MKIIALTTLTLATLASAAVPYPTTCRDNLDHGYSVALSPGGTAAQVRATTFADTKILAKLRCYAPENQKSELLLQCSEPYLRDAGYGLVIYKTHDQNRDNADLQRVTILGSESLTKLHCQ